jgi:hypothetical protein
MDYHIHDHEDILGGQNFRHDHPTLHYPESAHRHLSRRSGMVLPPTVTGCLHVGHNEVDCYVAAAKGDIMFGNRCTPCRSAMKLQVA